MVLDVIEGSLKTAQSISEFGIMVVICAFFVVMAACLMIFMFKWTVNTINDVMRPPKYEGNNDQWHNRYRGRPDSGCRIQFVYGSNLRKQKFCSQMEKAT